MAHDDPPAPILDPSELDLPSRPRVKRIVIEPYVNHSGEHELMVWILFDDRTSDREFISGAVLEAERVITDAVWATGERRFPYTSLLRVREFRRHRRAG